MLIPMMTQDPIFSAVSLFFSLLTLLLFSDKLPSPKQIGSFLLIMLAVTLINPLISHNGKTILFYINGNRYTLEALLYGFNSSLLLISSLIWIRLLSICIDFSKSMYVFSNISVKLAFLISASFSFFGLISEKAEKITEADKCFHHSSDTTVSERMRNAYRSFSCLVSDSFEEAMISATVMESKGAFLKKGKTHRFAEYRYRPCDRICMIATLMLDVMLIFGIVSDQPGFVYYPEIQLASNYFSLISYISYTLLAFILPLTEVIERVKLNAWAKRIERSNSHESA